MSEGVVVIGGCVVEFNFGQPVGNTSDVKTEFIQQGG